MAPGLLLLAVLLVFSNDVQCNASLDLITDLAEVLMNNYCSPEKLSGMEELMGIATSNAEILSIQDPNIFASMLTDGFRSTIGDPRLKVTYDPNYVPAAPPEILDIPLEQLAAVVKGTVNVEILEDNIAYLKIHHIIGEEVAQKIGPLLLQHVWDKVLPTSAMILDLRYSVSGELSGIPYIVSYYTSAESLIHIDSVYDRPSNSTTELWSMPTLLGKRYGTEKPLIILTSKDTVGIAEDVAYCLKNLNRATIVGENTAGGSVKMDTMKLGNTDFYVSVPVAKSTNPITGKSWEVEGVAPDVAVNAEDAIDAAVAIIKLRAEIPEIVKSTATLVKESYAFDHIGANVAEKLEVLLATGEYNMISSKDELKEKLTADLINLSGDKCLKITDNNPVLPPISPSPEMLVALINDLFHTDVFENNIGYIRFDMFGDFPQLVTVAQIIVEQVWDKVVDTNAMIIDLRNNIGGSTNPIAGFCSYFFDEDMRIVLDKLYDRSSGTTKVFETLPDLTGRRYGFNKGLLILTSGVTAGAAEEFVYIMKKLGRAMIVGEPTHGSCQPPETIQISNNQIFLSIPVTHSDTTQGPAWEGVGIAPHVTVPASEALDVARDILTKHFLGQK